VHQSADVRLGKSYLGTLSQSQLVKRKLEKLFESSVIIELHKPKHNLFAKRDSDLLSNRSSPIRGISPLQTQDRSVQNISTFAQQIYKSPTWKAATKEPE
jgi:hypothetical protein